jgi:hypothetical protein
LLPNRRFRVDIQREGYEPGGYVFATDDPSSYAYGQPLFLSSTEDIAGTGGVMNDTTSGNPPATNPGTGIPSTTGGSPMDNSGSEYTLYANGPKDNAQYSSTAARYNGEYFRVQIAALGSYKPESSKFSSLPSFGMVSTELIVDRGLTRVMVGDYFNQSEATFALAEIRKVHPEAYIVKYTDGIRYGRVNF